ncbi:RNA polymerase sigma factor [Steroidobacter sp.]|uniref:RNA polymerase sigma factor n=1 Tax=Steroidobacter sp. TaxID=1978227 RepID=UPI001A444736|nr:RNA polymerase sigma factor [Steroidobacter sp.]MBL8269824.1 RNA polymerase sigma factor [Steroidobacter sp.]
MTSQPLATQNDDSSELPAQLRPALIQFFLRRCGNVAEAEDLAQDVLVRTMLQTTGKSPEDAKGYIFRAAVNRWHDRQRRVMSRGQAVEWNDAAAYTAREDGTPERLIGGQQELHRVLAAVQELNERTRDILLLIRMEHFKLSEVAEMYGISVSAVNKHLAKAVAHIDRRLGRGRVPE